VKGRLATVQVLASGEEQFVQVSSRIVLSVCRLILAAVPCFWWVEAGQAGCGWAAYPGGDCWLPAARMLASGEERFVQASSRIVLSVCRLILAAVLCSGGLRKPFSCGWAVHTGGDRPRLLASCCSGACERRGAVRTGNSPDSSVGLPDNRRSCAVILVAGRWRPSSRPADGSSRCR
jgi:hypothetical protein